MRMPLMLTPHAHDAAFLRSARRATDGERAMQSAAHAVRRAGVIDASPAGTQRRQDREAGGDGAPMNIARRGMFFDTTFAFRRLMFLFCLQRRRRYSAAARCPACLMM